MKLGIGSYTYPWSVGVPGAPPPQPMTAFDLLDKAVELDVEVVQICDNLPLDALEDGELLRLGQQAKERGVQIEVGTRGIMPDHLQRCLQMAVQLQSPIIRVVIDTAELRPSWTETVEILRPTVPHLEQAGVCLAIENHDRFSAKQLCELVETLHSEQVGICLDTVNSFGALEGPEVVVHTLAPWVACLHVKDFTIRRFDHLMGFVIEGCPAGKGRLDVAWLLGEIKTAGRDPNVILEQWPPPEKSIGETIAKEDRWARTGVAYLRTLINKQKG